VWSTPRSQLVRSSERSSTFAAADTSGDCAYAFAQSRAGFARSMRRIECRGTTRSWRHVQAQLSVLVPVARRCGRVCERPG
jgi:hypothetical protein